MEQNDVVVKFIESLGKITPPKINGPLLKNYITNIVVDSHSLEDFIVHSDKYLKHSQTFQMSFLLHSLASVLIATPIGSPVLQVLSSIDTNAFDIGLSEASEIRKTDEAKRYDELCQKLMDYDSPEATSLENRIKKERKIGIKFDDATEPNQLFNPLKTKFPTQEQAGEDLTDELEIRD